MERPAINLLLALVLLTGCLSGDPSSPRSGTDGREDRVELPGAEIITPNGTITLALYPEVAPKTVAHISALIRDGWYNGTTFYRTVDDFVIQGGPQDDREPADTVPLEAGAQFAAGTLGLARDLERDSGTSHFFVTEYPQEHLHDPDPQQSAAGTVYGEFTAFGQVVDGMAVVREIAQLPQAELAPGIDDPSSDQPRDPPPMEIRLIPLEMSREQAEELPYRTWGRQRAPPYRISVDSPGTLRPQTDTWLRVFVEEEEDESAPDLDPGFEVTGPDGQAVPVDPRPLPDDPDVHRLALTFPDPGAYTLSISDGMRELTTFDLRVEEG